MAFINLILRLLKFTLLLEYGMIFNDRLANGIY